MEANMQPPILILLVGILYVVVFGALSAFRREGLSGQFALVAMGITAIFTALSAMNIVQPHPVVLLIVLYLVTMRVRLVVDLANAFAARGKFERAEEIYRLGERFWPDTTSALLLQLNRSIAILQQDDPDTAIRLLEGVLGQSESGRLGVKQEAAAHYNLGVAYLRKDMKSKARIEFNQVLETWPATLYARHAQTALERLRREQGISTDNV
jgi:tetratricopeptide (TPR) repeat protein